MALVQSHQDAPPNGAANAAPVPNQQNLPMRKRKQEAGNLELCANEAAIDKKLKTASGNSLAYTTTNTVEFNTPNTMTTTSDLKPLKRPPMSKAREIRLEQNRKAARESRRRKKVMVEELQRSVVFFTRANSTLKQQNEELERMLLQAQSHIQAYENGRSNQSQGSSNSTATPVQEPSSSTPAAMTGTSVEGTTQRTDGTVDQRKEIRESEAQQAVASAQTQQVQKLPSMTQEIQAHHAAQAAATQAMFETKGFPPAAARAAAQTFVAAPGDSDAKGDASTITTAGAAAVVNQPKFANAPTAGNITLATNPWSFLVAMAPGQISHLANSQQQGAAAGMSAVSQGPGASTGKTDFNPFFAMQMQPFLTTVLGANGASISMPFMQLAAMNKGNPAVNIAASSHSSTPPTASTSALSTTNEMNDQNGKATL